MDVYGGGEKKMNLKSQAISGVKWSGISMGAVTALQFVTLAVLARLLSPSDFGLMGMIMVVVGFAQLFADMGISNAIIYRQDATRKELSSLYWLNILAGIVIFFVICGVSPLITSFYHEPRLSNLIYFSSLIFLIIPLGQQFQILLQKELKFDQLAKIQIIGSFANSATAIILAIMGMGVFSLIWGQLAGTSLRVILLFYWRWGNWRPRLHFSIRDLKGYISFGLYQMGEKTVNYFNSNFDYLLIGSLLGADALGYYTLAYNLIIRPSSMINPIITRVAFPVFSRIQNKTVGLKRGYLKVLQFLSVVNFPIMIGMAVVAPVAIPLIFGEKWIPSIILIQILSVVGLLRATGNPAGALLLARGRADLGFKWNLALMITQIPGLFIGAKLGGTIGVAIAFAILQILYSVANYLVLIKTLIGKCFNEYFSSMWPAFWISTIMAMTVFSVSMGLHNMSPSIILALEILIGASVYLFLFYIRQKPLLIEIKEIILGKT